MPSDNDLMYSQIFNGLAQGLKEGLMYRQQREDRNKQFEFEQKRLDLQEEKTLADDEKQKTKRKQDLYLQGVEEDPTTGELVELPDEKKPPKLLAELKAKESATKLAEKKFNFVEKKWDQRVIKNDELSKLPGDKQLYIKDLTKDNAGKISIANNLQANLNKLEDPKIDDKVRLQVAKQLLKTMNSTQGKDAIGAEEAQRLGEFLQPYVLNPLSARGLSVGQDLPRFLEQVELNTTTLRNSIDMNNQEIDKTFGEFGVSRKSTPTGSGIKPKAANPRQKDIDSFRLKIKAEPDNPLNQKMEAKIKEWESMSAK